MQTCTTVAAALCLTLASAASFADTSAPALLESLAESEISLIDDSTQQSLRGEYITGYRYALGLKYFRHCSKSYIQCYGTQYISPNEFFIKFSFRSTPWKTEYKGF